MFLFILDFIQRVHDISKIEIQISFTRILIPLEHKPISRIFFINNSDQAVPPVIATTHTNIFQFILKYHNFQGQVAFFHITKIAFNCSETNLAAVITATTISKFLELADNSFLKPLNKL